MQKVFVFLPILLIILAVEFAAANNRARRFCCPDASSAGGRLGCVVSQNKLFINGRFVKDLSEDEQQELNIYKQAQQDFKEQVHTYLEQRFNASNEAQVESLKKPVPPKKPSFCSSKARTQYVFDGCTVQGDSVFIGDQFVRKLDDEEQQQLKEFDQQFNSYQKAMSGQIRRQVQEAFGHAFGQLFGQVGGGSGEGTTAEDGEMEGGENATELASSTAESAEVGTKNSTLPELPKAPEFCTLIV